MRVSFQEHILIQLENLKQEIFFFTIKVLEKFRQFFMY